MEPPNSSWLPFMVRVSTTILIRFFSCRIVSAGSACEMPSTDLFSIAATTEAPAPTPMATMSVGLQPALGRPVVDQHVGLRARRGDAELHALDIGRSLDLLGDVVAQADGELHAAADQGEALDGLAALLHADRVLVGAGHHVGAAAHQGLERLGAALEVVDLDVEARILEEALGLGDRDRQVVERRLAADRQHQLGLLGFARLCPRHVRRGHQSRRCRQNRTAPHVQLGHCFLPETLWGGRVPQGPAPGNRAKTAHSQRLLRFRRSSRLKPPSYLNVRSCHHGK